jgi:hypothetical protein
MSETLLAAVFVPLLAAHLVIDFLVQTKRDVELKANLNLLTFGIHAGQHALLAYALVGAWDAWTIPLLVFAFHLVIDLAKETLQRGFLARSAGGASRIRLHGLVLDQTAHVVSLLVVTWIVRAVVAEVTVPAPTVPVAILILVSGWIVTARVGGFIVGFATQPFLDELTAAADERPTSDRPVRGLTRGGQAIGALERTLIYLLILMGVETGVGFLIAAKSIFRFGELKDPRNRMEAEYIIIGTLLSFAWGVASAWGTMLLMQELT